MIQFHSLFVWTIFMFWVCTSFISCQRYPQWLFLEDLLVTRISTMSLFDIPHRHPVLAFRAIRCWQPCFQTQEFVFIPHYFKMLFQNRVISHITGNRSSSYPHKTLKSVLTNLLIGTLGTHVYRKPESAFEAWMPTWVYRIHFTRIFLTSASFQRMQNLLKLPFFVLEYHRLKEPTNHLSCRKMNTMWQCA